MAGKKFKSVKTLVDNKKIYPVEEAVALAKKLLQLNLIHQLILLSN